MFCSVNLHYCSSPSGCQLTGQGLLVPWRPSWLHSHSSSQQLHTQSLIITLALAQQHPWDHPQGQMMLHRAMERVLGEEGDARMSCSSRESTPEVPIPEGAGWTGRWEQQLCSFGRATPFAKGWRWKISPDHPWSRISRQEGEPSRPRDTSLLPWHLP